MIDLWATSDSQLVPSVAGVMRPTSLVLLVLGLDSATLLPAEAETAPLGCDHRQLAECPDLRADDV
ncbi:MAG: hypothetical protein JWQ20_810 [Conexibacter sp.]|nr:hypothetical protein [Conexibacter sp.]